MGAGPFLCVGHVAGVCLGVQDLFALLASACFMPHPYPATGSTSPAILRRARPRDTCSGAVCHGRRSPCLAARRRRQRRMTAWGNERAAGSVGIWQATVS